MKKLMDETGCVRVTNRMVVSNEELEYREIPKKYIEMQLFKNIANYLLENRKKLPIQYIERKKKQYNGVEFEINFWLIDVEKFNYWNDMEKKYWKLVKESEGKSCT